MIENLRQLKDAIKKINSKWSNTDGSDQAVIDEALKLIDSFEAVVWARLKSIQSSLKVKAYPQYKVSVVVDEAILEELEKELSRLLEGEGVEKGESSEDNKLICPYPPNCPHLKCPHRKLHNYIETTTYKRLSTGFDCPPCVEAREKGE